MDNSGPRSGSTTPQFGSDGRFERPLPPIPGSESIPISWDNDGAANEASPSNGSRDQNHIDMRGLYDEDALGDGPEINLHDVDGSLLDIYPSRSNSSLSVTSPELLTRAPYLEGVSNSSPRPSSTVGDHSTPRGGSPELSRSYQREVSGSTSNLVPVSLREFLGDGSSTSRSGTSMPARSTASGLSSAGDSRIGSREGQGRPQGAVWRESEPESTASVSVRTPARTPTRTPTRSMRSGPNDDFSSSGSSGDSPLLSHDSPSQIRHRLHPPPSPSPEFVLPRWQPDAEVTFCPICRTQFSFFVRKHHCRKCGRVVCNSCSPHRITIPYQYIVQPPLDGGSPTSSDPHPPHRTETAGSLEVASLGGGERVRLCNPCVPDPNTAPPVNTQRPASYQGRHSRSASTTAVPQNTSGDYSPTVNAEFGPRLGNVQPRTREPSILGNPNRYLQAQNQSRGPSYNERGDRLLRPDDFQSRSRSSTVGSSRDQTMGGYPSSIGTSLERSHSVRGHPHYRPLIPSTTQSDPRMERQAPPEPPRSDPPRRQIPEDDECWVCHEELPSRELPDFQDVRDAHVQACLDTAMAQLTLSSPPSSTPPPTQQSPSQTTEPSQAGPSGSSPTPATVPNTPEGRAAAREQAHAAVVLGQNRPSPSTRHFGGTIFPYKASEKDCVQQAECSICFEEYEAGQDMARLQCFCRFHLQCIRGWYAKMPGKCPLHDHDRGD